MLPNFLIELQDFVTSIYQGLMIEFLYILITVISAILVHCQPTMCVPCIAVLLLFRLSQVYEDYRIYRSSDWRGMLAGFTVLMACYIVGATGVCDVVAYGCTMILGKFERFLVDYGLRQINLSIFDVKEIKPHPCCLLLTNTYSEVSIKHNKNTDWNQTIKNEI